MSMLKLSEVSAFYGVVQALFSVSLEVSEGEIVCLIGPNGAGKTTTIKVITGMVKPASGTVEFVGNSIHNQRTSGIIRAGIGVVPEGRRVFPRMTVLENLEIGAFVRRGRTAELQESLAGVFELFPVLKERRDQAAGTLSGGEQEMLALGRAMMSRPRLMLLDEPSMGLAPVLVERTFEAIKKLNEQGTTILLVEQNAHMALSISTRGYVLEGGKVQLSGTAEELKRSTRVKNLYLGGGDE